MHSRLRKSVENAIKVEALNQTFFSWKTQAEVKPNRL